MPNAKELERKIKSKYSLKEGFSTTPQPETIAQPPVQPATQRRSFAHPELIQPEIQAVQQQIMKPAYGRKMTLYVTEDLFKAFNDIYATRLLHGRATEKSALVCEAIALLYEKEKKEGHI